jgi:hypothetical protein
MMLKVQFEVRYVLIVYGYWTIPIHETVLILISLVVFDDEASED